MARLFSIARVSAVLSLCALASFPFFGRLVEAAVERYDYDALGRLVRSVDSDLQVTEYEYDAVGNILSVRRPGLAQPPQVTTVTPPSIRRLDRSRFTVRGENLSGTSVISPSRDLGFSALEVAAGEISFDLAPSQLSSLGPQTFVVQGAAGSAEFAIRIDPVLPTMSISPGPIAVPPDGTARNFVVTLSSPDSIEHRIVLASANPTIASVTPAEVVVPAGETRVAIQITGRQAGLTSIAMTSSALRSVSVPVFVTAEFSGLTTSYASQLGVVRSDSAEPPAQSLTQASSSLGVVIGGYVDGIQPDALVVGSEAATLTVTGAGLSGVTAVAVVPSSGVDVLSFDAAADGSSVAVVLDVAVDAPQILRRLVLTGPAGPYRAATPAADRFLVSADLPELQSVSPLFALPGTPNLALTIRGRNLQRASAVSLVPGNGIVVGTSPDVNADGTLMTVQIAVSPFAPVGDHVVVIQSPAGSSSSQPTAFNTIRVVEELVSTKTPIVAPLVGLFVEGSEPAQGPAYQLASTALGVSRGAIVTTTTPNVAVVGSTTQLTLKGLSLDNVSQISIEPATGLEYGDFDISGDGRELSLTLQVAGDAPLGPRSLRVMKGDVRVMFADPLQATLNIVLPQPELQSVTPIMLEQGASAVAVSLRGRNLAGATSVTLVPAAGIIAAPPVVNAAGTEATLNLSIAPDAPLGPRTILISTPAGTSDAAPVAANTVEVVARITGTVTPILARSLGIVREDLPGEPPVALVPLMAANLGIEVLQASSEPPSYPGTFLSDALGISVGSVVTRVQAPALLAGTTVSLRLEGVALQGFDGVVAVPAQGLSFGQPVVAEDGRSAELTMTIAADASAGLRALLINRGTQKIPVQPAASAHIRIARTAPAIVSISPILGYQGDTLKLVVRGTGLQEASAVLIEPGVGLSIDSHPVVNALGTELTLDLHVQPDAPIGSRVVRVLTPGGSTTSAPIPANTFTVYPSE
jgi:YD repeat-containing protein